MFTARYGLVPYIEQINLVFKGLIMCSLHACRVGKLVHLILCRDFSNPNCAITIRCGAVGAAPVFEDPGLKIITPRLIH